MINLFVSNGLFEYSYDPYNMTSGSGYLNISSNSPKINLKIKFKSEFVGRSFDLRKRKFKYNLDLDILFKLKLNYKIKILQFFKCYKFETVPSIFGVPISFDMLSIYISYPEFYGNLKC